MKKAILLALLWLSVPPVKAIESGSTALLAITGLIIGSCYLVTTVSQSTNEANNNKSNKEQLQLLEQRLTILEQKTESYKATIQKLQEIVAQKNTPLHT
jgi:hypothetical protein